MSTDLVPLAVLMFAVTYPSRAIGLLNPAIGTRAAGEIRVHRLVHLDPLDGALLRLGLQQRLRGADALYAATAQLAGAALISWDNELIQRAGAMTPSAWLAANP